MTATDTQVSTEYSEALERAAEEFEGRQQHTRQPIGYYQGGQRWWPDETRERRWCCSGLREPSYSWPNSLRNHCRTLAHVAEVFQVLPEDLRRRVRERAAAKKNA